MLRPISLAILGIASSFGSAHAEGWRLSTSASVQMIVSDNINFSPVAPSSDVLTEVTPTIDLRRRSPRLKLNANYSPRMMYYADDTFPSRIANNMSANGSFEVVDDLFFLDAKASQTQRRRSVFNAQPNLLNSTLGDSTETRVFSLSPSMRGTVRLGDIATWKSSYTIARSESSRREGALTTRTFSGTLQGAPATLSWKGVLSSRVTDSGNANNSERESIVGSLIYKPDVQIELTGRYGYEKSTIGNRRDGATYGGGLDWRPSQRTALSLDYDERPYGSTANYKLSHRLPRTAFNAAYTRNIVSRIDTLLEGSGLEDLYETLAFVEPYASIADPEERRDAIRADALAGRIPGYGSLDSPILTDREYRRSRWSLGVVHTGARNTLSFTMYQSTNDSGIGSGGGSLTGDFAEASVIVQKGWTIGLSHRLSPVSSLNFSLNSFDTSGRVTARTTTERNVFNATYSTALGAYTSGSIGLRMMRGTVAAGDVDENALIATVSTRFF